ncbi:Uncharacterised protein [Candidatus Tiddalikarchaeum anstoanum]|nr:Uncharacterised protein [Candidatus Tiddalikarchaeum anstoanum]
MIKDLNNKAQFGFDLVQLIGYLFFIIVVLFVVFSLSNLASSFLGNSFCSTTVTVRSMFANLFGGFSGIARAVIPTKVFNSIPLMCKTEAVVVKPDTENVEEMIANKAVECFNKFGGGKLNGLFPYASFLCSVIIYDVPDDGEHYIDLMKVYDKILNNSNFDKNFDYGDEVNTVDDRLTNLASIFGTYTYNKYNTFNYDNYFRFCLNPNYYYYTTEQSSRMNCHSKTSTGILEGYVNHYIDDNWETGADPTLYSYYSCSIDNSFSFLDLFTTKCLSLRESAVNLWSLNLSQTDTVSKWKTVTSEIQNAFKKSNREPIFAQFKNDLCMRECASVATSFTDYNYCEVNCTSLSVCNQYSCNLKRTANGFLYDATPELSSLFRYPGFITPYELMYKRKSIISDVFDLLVALIFGVDTNAPISNPYMTYNSSDDSYAFNRSTILRRGTIYIRFYDYTDWLQAALNGTWPYFPEVDNDITQFSALGISSESISRKHDYLVIGYTPYIPYELLHPEESVPISQSVTVVT